MPEHDRVYAETASEAWATPRTLRAAVRSAARSATLSAAAAVFAGKSRFVRCLYSHAVFPEQRMKFRAIIRWLKNQGDFVGTDDLIDLLRRGHSPEGRYYHLSFDDGFANVHEVACDVLIEERVPATLFVSPSFIDANYTVLESYFRRLSAYRKPVRVMPWAQIARAVEAGIEIGSHTMTHARLSDISRNVDLLWNEIRGSKESIEAFTGLPCKSFAWPYGTMKDIDAAGFERIKAAGYQIAFSAVRGCVGAGTDLFCVPRHQIEFHWPSSHIRLWARGFRE